MKALLKGKPLIGGMRPRVGDFWEMIVCSFTEDPQFFQELWIKTSEWPAQFLTSYKMQ